MSQAATNQKPLGKARNSEAWRDPWSLPLESLDPAQAILFKENLKTGADKVNAEIRTKGNRST